jgi:hypothetical protein
MGKIGVFERCKEAQRKAPKIEPVPARQEASAELSRLKSPEAHSPQRNIAVPLSASN